MKKGTKKLVAALFAAAILASVIPAGVNASQKKIGKCGEKAYATYDASTKTVYIKGSGEMNDYNIEQAPWAQKNVRKVVIGNKITSIGDAAFSRAHLIPSRSRIRLRPLESLHFASLHWKMLRYQRVLPRSKPWHFPDAVN